MTVYRASSANGLVLRIKGIRLRRQLDRELDQLVGAALEGTTYAPGTRALNTCIKRTETLEPLVRQLLGRPEITTFFLREELVMLGVRRDQWQSWVRACVVRLHRLRISELGELPMRHTTTSA